jgi:hypothetical protein
MEAPRATRKPVVDAPHRPVKLQSVRDLKAERGPDAALRAMQQRFDAANLRVQIATAEHRLTELTAFERDFRDLTAQLRPLIQGCIGSDWPPRDSMSRPRVLAADMLRLDLRSRIATVFSPYAADPLAMFLNTSLRAYDPRQDKLFVVTTLDPAGDPASQVSAEQFEVLVAECESIIAAYRRDQQEQIRLQASMLEEANRLQADAERALGEERAHELAKVQAAVTPTFRAWVEQRRQSWPWKYIWPFVEKPLRNALWPVLVGAAVAAWHWLRTLL